VARSALLADAERSLERSRNLGAATGHLWAWRDLLSDTAAEAATATTAVSGRQGAGGSAGAGGTGGTDARLDARRHDLDAAEARIRSALADLGLRTGSPERRAPWSG
jgi:hypothetical protein